MKMSEKLVRLRSDKGLTQQDIAKIAGVSDKAISSWENESRSPKLGSIQKICDYFHFDLKTFIDENNDNFAPSIQAQSNIETIRWGKPVPLVGDIACGTPILAEQNIMDYVDTPEHIKADFALRCRGESMIDAGVHDGDIVFVRQQPEVDNGQIAAVLVDGAESEATLKRVYVDNGILTLQAANPAFPPKAFFGEDINRVHILGRAVAFIHVFKEC